MGNDLVGYSRAGDTFHYRWAARRCLRLLYPNAELQQIVIEGSTEKEKAGEYSIDVSEYYSLNGDGRRIAYYQLKHTTVRKHKPFSASDLKPTIENFAKRFLQHYNRKKKTLDAESLSFAIVSNRKISAAFKKNVAEIAADKPANLAFLNTIKAYTKLSGRDLIAFCQCLIFEDAEGDYQVQKDELRLEIAQLVAGADDTAEVNALELLVRDKVLPNSGNVIKKEDVLLRFGKSFERDLFPAPAVWEEMGAVIVRAQHKAIQDKIAKATEPVIIHAAGGVGKTVFCRQLIASLPTYSLGIAYDCFGAAMYRNRSEPRHRHRDALVQITNELAAKGLCKPMLDKDTSLNDQLMRGFLAGVKSAAAALRKADKSAQLVIVIDAADNAEMAAAEFNDDCFAKELIREKFPDECKVVLLCRTERINLLSPKGSTPVWELQPFSEAESLTNLKLHYPRASVADGAEFHRLTSANPRVQANALNVKHKSVSELLSSLGPSGLSVEDQINDQLKAAISRLKEIIPGKFQSIDSICLGLASLPPHVPLDVLAKAAGVPQDAVRSFVTDIGRSLWLTDSSVQFRDEPTETFFRSTFCAAKEEFAEYADKLEPLAAGSTYVAEALPQLYLQAGQYDKLISIALSDNYLPADNPINARSVRVYRLQFAFKAALKAKQYKDAIKIAMRAGEEVAGTRRQLSLQQGNIDLLVSLQGKEEVQAIALRRKLAGSWEGSENCYTASLLSGIPEFKGEARGYLRSAVNWLEIFFREREKEKDGPHEKDVEEQDILEMLHAAYNLHGGAGWLAFCERFNPEWLFEVVKDLAKRFIDLGNFQAADEILQLNRSEVYFVIAIASELTEVCRFPDKKMLAPCLALLATKKRKIRMNTWHYRDRTASSFLNFIEACVRAKLPRKQILLVLGFYFPKRAPSNMHSSHDARERTTFLRAAALRTLLEGDAGNAIDDILPDSLHRSKTDKKKAGDDIDDFSQVVGSLLPWFLLRARAIANSVGDFLKEANQASEASRKATERRYRRHDQLPWEVVSACRSVIVAHDKADEKEVGAFFDKYLAGNGAFSLPNMLGLVRAAYRCDHLRKVARRVEQLAHDIIKSDDSAEPNEISGLYIDLARGVLTNSVEDASVYFDDAVKSVSKFGDEIVERWEAIVAIGKQAVLREGISDSIAHRFARCAEIVGNSVAREKHWNRYEAVSVCARMSPAVGISMVSRWRDRDIGTFEYQLNAVLTELLNSNRISAAVGWVLTKLCSPYYRTEFIDLCLRKELTKKSRLSLLSDIVATFQKEGVGLGFWKKLHQIASANGLTNDDLEATLSFAPAGREDSTQSKGSVSKRKPEKKFDAIYKNLNILSSAGFEELITRFKKMSEADQFRGTSLFWQETVKRVGEKDLWTFLEVVLQSEEANKYDLQTLWGCIPDDWKTAVSFKKKWPHVVKQCGRAYSYELANIFAFDYFSSAVNLDSTGRAKLTEGIIEGLALGYEFAGSDVLFGFVSIASSLATSDEALELLDFSLSRFEIYISPDQADGPWDDWLHVGQDISQNVAGLLWSALGSPRAEIRWRAAHSIHKLAEFRCTDVIDGLFYWFNRRDQGAFGSKNFVFYDLHARLYFLIAMSRISIDTAELLEKYAACLIETALSERHLLIQRYATGIAFNIESALPGTCDKAALETAKERGISQLSTKSVNWRHETVNSYWHERNEIDRTCNYHVGLDFDAYWLRPLGEAFGVPQKQVEELVAEVVVNEWGIQVPEGKVKDARSNLWNRSSSGRETWYRHSDYPKTDDLTFYYSYHAMLVVAGKLLEKMHTLVEEDSAENRFEYWLSRHLLTRPDGRWISDCRDPVPLSRPSWIFDLGKGTESATVPDSEFLDCLKATQGTEVWLTVNGGWHERNDSRAQNFSIRSALVSKTASNALLNALATCSDPYDYKLPYYEEEDMEVNAPPFMLMGWIDDIDVSKAMDELDPFAEDADYPPYSVGKELMDKLGLAVSPDGRQWKSSNFEREVMRGEIWSSLKDQGEEATAQAGKRLRASVAFLKQLCSVTGCDLILNVQIKRDILHRHREEQYEYTKPLHKVFIFSANGKLRDTERSYRIG